MARVGVSSSEEGDIHLERSNSIPICSPAAEADSKTLAPDVCHSVADEAFSASRGGALEDVQDILAALAFVDFSRQSSRKTLVARRSSFAQALKENGHLVLPRLSKSYTAVSLVESARRWTTVAGPSYDVPSLISPSNSTSVAQNITESDPDEDVGESRIHSNRQPPPTNCRRHTASNSGETAQSLPCLSLETRRNSAMENLERIVHPLDKLLSKDNWDPAVRKYHSIEEALQHAGTGSLAFDAFQLDALTNGCPLSTLAMYLFSENRLIEDLGLDEVKTQNFFVRVEDTMQDNAYHNKVHIADVLQSLYAHTLVGGGLQQLCHGQPLHLLAVLLAAIIHDADHPGVNNDFLVKSRHPIALKYEEQDVAALNELHHLDTALRLLRSEDSNFLEKLSVQEWELVWAIVREMVLNTDMKQHLPFLEDMKSWRVDGQVPEQQCTSMEDISLIQVALQFSFAMKCADLGHCIRPAQLHIRWTKAVTSEFYTQGAQEESLGLPVTQGMYAPENEVEIFQSQAWFLENLVRPLFESWAKFSMSVHGDAMVQSLNGNIRMWQDCCDHGHLDMMLKSSVSTMLCKTHRSTANSADGLSEPHLPVQFPAKMSPHGDEKSNSATPCSRLSSSMRSIPLDQYLNLVDSPPSRSPLSSGSFLSSLLLDDKVRSIRRFSRDCQRKAKNLPGTRRATVASHYPELAILFRSWQAMLSSC